MNNYKGSTRTELRDIQASNAAQRSGRCDMSSIGHAWEQCRDPSDQLVLGMMCRSCFQCLMMSLLVLHEVKLMLVPQQTQLQRDQQQIPGT